MTTSAARAAVLAVETLGIGIPTRDRPGYLLALLGALFAQTKRPEAVCVVNDGSPALAGDPAMQQMAELWRTVGVRFEILKGTQRGASPNHQVALERLRTDLVLRLDDDLLPARPDFVERLYRLISGKAEVGAVGGVYPLAKDGEARHYGSDRGRPGMTNGLDDLLAGRAGLQFRRYEDEAVVDGCEHLYSSWMYRASYLQAVGGFADCYSRFGQREESDASVRLRLLGGHKLLVDVGAVACHFLAGGGRRPEGSRQRIQEDDAIFRRRVQEWRRAR
jgi:GT2 family glycosyltransferase